MAPLRVSEELLPIFEAAGRLSSTITSSAVLSHPRVDTDRCRRWERRWLVPLLLLAMCSEAATSPEDESLVFEDGLRWSPLARQRSDLLVTVLSSVERRHICFCDVDDDIGMSSSFDDKVGSVTLTEAGSRRDDGSCLILFIYVLFSGERSS